MKLNVFLFVKGGIDVIDNIFVLLKIIYNAVVNGETVC